MLASDSHAIVHTTVVLWGFGGLFGRSTRRMPGGGQLDLAAVGWQMQRGARFKLCHQTAPPPDGCSADLGTARVG